MPAVLLQVHLLVHYLNALLPEKRYLQLSRTDLESGDATRSVDDPVPRDIDITPLQRVQQAAHLARSSWSARQQSYGAIVSYLAVGNGAYDAQNTFAKRRKLLCRFQPVAACLTA